MYIWIQPVQKAYVPTTTLILLSYCYSYRHHRARLSLRIRHDVVFRDFKRVYDSRYPSLFSGSAAPSSPVDHLSGRNGPVLNTDESKFTDENTNLPTERTDRFVVKVTVLIPPSPHHRPKLERFTDVRLRSVRSASALLTTHTVHKRYAHSSARCTLCVWKRKRLAFAGGRDRLRRVPLETLFVHRTKLGWRVSTVSNSIRCAVIE